MNSVLTERQQRELDYHREHAKEHRRILAAPFSWDVLEHPGRRWWNAYWQMFAYLVTCDLVGKDVLVVGCGFGEDALRLAKLGARVSAFDLSPEAIQIAGELAQREGLKIDFQVMPAEGMKYPDSMFDCVVARDILHHVEIPATMKEIVRVAKPDALFVVNEIYSHTITDKIRHSTLVEKVIYPRMQQFVYGKVKPYITADERKLTERDLKAIMGPLRKPEHLKHFNFIVTRLVPDRFDHFAKADRLLLRLLKPIGHVLAGRVLFGAHVRK